jgi:ribosomal protein S18 acetylase RimI-like enzyme
MPAMLRNLLARAPNMDDLEAVAELRMASDLADYGMPDSTEQDILVDWQRPGFNLNTDAWVVVTTDGLFVGYASVWHCQYMRLYTFACVHPAYRGRGIGMLLLRLAEARAREQVGGAHQAVRVTLQSTVSHSNEGARRLLEREGYILLRHFWRLIVDTEDDPSESLAEDSQRGKLKLDLVVDAQNLVGTTQVHQRTGIYLAREYDIYEKELRAGRERPLAESLSEAMACA